MTTDNASHNRHLSISMNAAAIIAAGVALSWHCVNASAQERPGVTELVTVFAPGHAHADLERVFWACDHAATSELLDVGMARSCSENYEEVKRTKFNGDFDALLAWWHQNKAVEHQALDRSRRAGGVPRSVR